MFRSSCLWFLLICSIAICYGDSEDDEEAISPNRTEVDFALARTLNIIARKTERGRLALLLCNVHCPKDKRMVPEWVRKFNDQQGYTFSERVAYHYYFLKHHLPLLNETGPITEPTIVFLIGKEVFVYPGVISDQESLLKWLEELDQDDVIIPKTHEELDMYLNTQNCSDKYLIYSAHDKCQIPQWRSIARIVRLKMQIKTIYIRRPIADHQMSTVLFKRLPLMNEQDCMFMTFVQLRSYSYPLTIGTPAQMAEHLSLLTTDNECVMLDDGFSLPISAPLSDLEMEYFTGERRLFHLEQSTAYVIVGATSGVAVIALAISIFWGLNGTAFAA
ncbi:hypothetical protein PMAYCL1PPCAC_31785 [Pristionchus mayeri]|uniref:Thioredoxin-like fold domain-containing protein n=1 Tax=Pristionchus mayeri TaxID=1317129 RepID=A0AAN5IEW2_9BILA|nr:hypothetical protein PMAYCL1PPCAC_31785 [Pristionchus mayeri]